MLPARRCNHCIWESLQTPAATIETTYGQLGRGMCRKLTNQCSVARCSAVPARTALPSACVATYFASPVVCQWSQVVPPRGSLQRLCRAEVLHLLLQPVCCLLLLGLRTDQVANSTTAATATPSAALWLLCGAGGL